MEVDSNSSTHKVVPFGERDSLLETMEEDLREHRLILQNLYDSSPCLMGVIELAESTVLAVNINNAAVRFFATEPEPFESQSRRKLTNSEKLNDLLARQCRHCLVENMPVSFEYEQVTGKGRRWFSAVISSVGTDNNDCPRFSIVAEDITGRKRWEEEIHRSQNRLSDILESISDGFLSVSYQWDITYINRRAAVNSGFQREELIGRNLWEVFPELVNTAHESNYRKTMAHRSSRHFEMSGTATDNWYDVSVYPSPEGISIYWIDISERKSTEKKLQQANDQLETKVAERTKELALMVASLQDEVNERKSTEKNLLQLNQLYSVLSETNQAIVHTAHQESLFQEVCRVAVQHGCFKMAWIGLIDENLGIIRPEAWSGSDEGYLDIIRSCDQNQLTGLPATSSVLREGVLWICNDIANETDQPWREEMAKRDFLSAAAIPLKKNGQIIGVFTIYADGVNYFRRQLVYLLQQIAVDLSFALDTLDLASRRREAEMKLRDETNERLRTLEKLREQDRMLMEQNRHAAMGEMISNIAHQWRQPLNSLSLLIQRLPLFYEAGKFDKDFLDDSAQKAIELIRHMSQTIDDFRNYFKQDKAMTTFKLPDVVAKTLSLVEGSFKEYQIELEVKANDAPVVTGYANEYAQILLNILINARDAFLERKDITKPRIVIELGMSGAKTFLTITDNAGGVPEEILPKIFDPYFTTKGPDKGTGLGLHMAKTLIEKNMQGLLTARNTGEGAEFKIEV